MSSAFHDEHGGHGHGPTYARGPSTGVALHQRRVRYYSGG